MSFLMALVTLGGLAYTGYEVTKGISNGCFDGAMKATANEGVNEIAIYDNFKKICKRNNIKLDEKGYPCSDKNLNNAIAYLKHRGYSDESIDYFTKMFNRRVKDHEKNEARRLENKFEELRKKLEKEKCVDTVIMRKKIYRSDLSPQDRINALLENDVWRKLVHHQTYVKDGGNWVEIWTLKVPSNFFLDIDKHILYRDVCKVQNVPYIL